MWEEEQEDDDDGEWDDDGLCPDCGEVYHNCLCDEED